MNLDRFSRPMSWERNRRNAEIDELEEYKRIRDMELEEDADDKSSDGDGHESSNRSR